MEGYIKLYRKLLDSDVFASQIGLKIWVWCLLKANYSDRFVPIKIGKRESVITVKRGSFIFGRFKAEEELCIDGSTIYKWIKKFEEDEMIVVESSSHYSVITVCNYEQYQQGDDDEVAAIQQPLNSHSTAIQQPSSSQVAATQQPRNTTKNNKNNKKDKNYKNNLLSEIDSSNFPELKQEHIEIAKSFQAPFKNNLIEAGASTVEIDNAKGSWVDHVRLMIEKDGYTVEDMRAVYKFLQVDVFWKQHIESTSKLREQMTKLKLKMHNGTKDKTNIGGDKPIFANDKEYFHGLKRDHKPKIIQM